MNYVNKFQKNILKNINLKIYEGDFIAIMGENGCGKTTLAKHMNGLIVPTSGDVFVGNINTRQSYDCSKIAKFVSLTFQNPDEQIIMSMVEDEIAFGLANICFPSEKMSIKISEVLNFVGLEGYEKHTTESLSGGQKQKLMLACALATEPKVIVLDEVTSMLDPIAKRNVIDILLKINQTQKTSLIMITHEPNEVALAQKVLLMKNGEIKITDSSHNPHEIMKILENL